MPLVRCDYESTLKAADSHRKETSMDNSEKGDSSPPKHNMLSQSQHTQPEVCTSGRAHTVIDYKKFFEDFADEPPSPPKKKHGVDLK